jgi:hypothetical protein
LWIYLFIVLPVAVFVLGLALTWLPALGILLVLLARIGTAYRRRAAARRPRSSSGDLAVMLLSPPGAIRAADRFTRRACEGMRTVRIARTMASEEEFCRWARLVYFDPTIDNEPLKDEIAKTVAGGELHRLFSDPPAADAGMTGFCPRCHQQYLRRDGDCADCIDVPIRPLAHA